MPRVITQRRRVKYRGGPKQHFLYRKKGQVLQLREEGKSYRDIEKWFSTHHHWKIDHSVICRFCKREIEPMLKRQSASDSLWANEI